MDVVIYGHGAHGQDVAEVVAACGHHVAGWLDDDPVRQDVPADLNPHLIQIPTYMGINDPEVKASRSIGLYRGPPLIHPDASVTLRRSSDIHDGCVVSAGATLGNCVYLDQHVHIGAGSTLVRCYIKAWSTIGPGVDIGGDVTIGKRVFVGIGARISNLVTIGDDAVIGAGAVVLHDVPAGATAVGVPARIIEKVRT